ncbi:MAG TPA: ABC transporter permease [Acidobacteriota bacterium]|nr:ABC transporter permease [Acidobacteriota bacterium]
MTLFRTFILRRLRQQPLATAATIVGVALGIAVVLAIQMANSASVQSFAQAVETMAGKTSLEIVPKGAFIDETVLASLGWLREYGSTSPVIEADILIKNRQGVLESVRLLGMDILRDHFLREYRVLDLGEDETRAAREILSLLLDSESIVLTQKFARRNGLGVGSEVEVIAGDKVTILRVAGLLRDIGPARTLDGNFALMDIAAAQLLVDRLGRIDRVDIKLDADIKPEEAAQKITKRLPPELQIQPPGARGRQVEKMLEAFHFNLMALSYIALIVGLFLIYNNISTSVISRREEIGMLRALGLSRPRLLALFIGEAAFLSVIGCALGLVLTRSLALGAIAATSTTVNSLYVTSQAEPPPLGPWEIALAFGIGIPLSLISATLPAAEAARITPVAAVRSADRFVFGNLKPLRYALISLALGLAAWRLAKLPPLGGLPIAGYASALAAVFAAAFAVRPALLLTLKSGRRLLNVLFGIEGRLASANLLASIRRTSIPVAALSISLAMMVAIGIMVGSFRQTVIYWVEQTLQADLYVRPATRSNIPTEAEISEEAEKIITSHPAIVAVSRYRNFDVIYGDALVIVAGGDLTTQLERGAIFFKEPADRGRAMRLAREPGAVIASESFSLRHGKRLGDTVTLPTAHGTQLFKIAAIFYDYSSDRGVLVMDYSALSRHYGTKRPTNLSLYLKPGADPEEVRSDILNRLGNRYRYFLYTNSSLKTEVLRVFDNTFVITRALEIIAISVAILGVVTSLLTLIIERKHDLTILRLVGAERKQVRKMVMIESGLMGTISQATGIVVGFLLSLILIYVINVQSFGWTIQFRIPWSFLAQTTCLILIATVLSGIYPAYLATKSALMEQAE